MAKKSLADIRILLAEDEENNFFLMQSICQRYKIDYMRACNGKVAIELAEQETFDLILMDLKMPIIGGLEATRTIRERDQNIPIIAITSYAFEEDRRNAEDAGCTDYLTKPVRLQNLIETLEKYI